MSVHAGVVVLGGLLLGIAGLQLQSGVLSGGLGHVPLIARVCTAELKV